MIPTPPRTTQATTAPTHIRARGIYVYNNHHTGNQKLCMVESVSPSITTVRFHRHGGDWFEFENEIHEVNQEYLCPLEKYVWRPRKKHHDPERPGTTTELFGPPKALQDRFDLKVSIKCVGESCHAVSDKLAGSQFKLKLPNKKEHQADATLLGFVNKRVGNKRSLILHAIFEVSDDQGRGGQVIMQTNQLGDNKAHCVNEVTSLSGEVIDRLRDYLKRSSTEPAKSLSDIFPPKRQRDDLDESDDDRPHPAKRQLRRQSTRAFVALGDCQEQGQSVLTPTIPTLTPTAALPPTATPHVTTPHVTTPHVTTPPVTTPTLWPTPTTSTVPRVFATPATSFPTAFSTANQHPTVESQATFATASAQQVFPPQMQPFWQFGLAPQYGAQRQLTSQMGFVPGQVVEQVALIVSQFSQQIQQMRVEIQQLTQQIQQSHA